MPKVINYATGYDLVKATLDGLSKIKLKLIQGKIVYVHIINTDKEGKVEKVSIEDEIKPFIKEFHQ